MNASNNDQERRSILRVKDGTHMKGGRATKSVTTDQKVGSTRSSSSSTRVDLEIQDLLASADEYLSTVKPRASTSTDKKQAPSGAKGNPKTNDKVGSAATQTVNNTNAGFMLEDILASADEYLSTVKQTARGNTDKKQEPGLQVEGENDNVPESNDQVKDAIIPEVNDTKVASKQDPTSTDEYLALLTSRVKLIDEDTTRETEPGEVASTLVLYGNSRFETQQVPRCFRRKKSFKESSTSNNVKER
jgi:hypothetical protein